MHTRSTHKTRVSATTIALAVAFCLGLCIPVLATFHSSSHAHPHGAQLAISQHCAPQSRVTPPCRAPVDIPIAPSDDDCSTCLLLTTLLKTGAVVFPQQTPTALFCTEASPLPENTASMACVTRRPGQPRAPPPCA